jgi:capsular exopolysaccharide synthesis family protein
MSHLRNLFHKPSEHIPLAISVAAAPHIIGATTHAAAHAVTAHAPTAHSSSVHVATAAPALPEFPVEEAYVGSENRLVFHADPRSPAADRYRLLRMKLKTLGNSGKLKKILITSPLAHDGKSTVTMNLATALAERGKRRVLVVETDLHHSSLGKSLKLRPGVGLTGCLIDDATSPFSAIRRLEPLGWYILAAGETRRNPTELLQAPAFGHIMEQLSPCFDWIVIDSPPVIPLTDSISLQQHADASILVGRAGRTPREAVEKTIELLGKKNILGVILNGMEARDHLYYQYYDGTKRYHDED